MGMIKLVEPSNVHVGVSCEGYESWPVYRHAYLNVTAKVIDTLGMPGSPEMKVHPTKQNDIGR